MSTTLATVDLGPVTLLAPEELPRHIVATHGHLWQWVGDGTDLFTLAVAVRGTRLGNQAGARHHLAWEIDQLGPGQDGLSQARPPVDVAVHVAGTIGAAAADVTGEVGGSEVRQRVLVTTDGQHMHVLRLVVPESDAGRELVERVTAAVRVQPWSATA